MNNENKTPVPEVNTFWVDFSREDYPEPCPDCNKTHLNGEHLALNVPVKEGGTRVAWEGCVDCWILRTNPLNRLVTIDKKED